MNQKPQTHRWLALAVLSLTQLVVVLDGTIINVALPQAQQDLGLSDSQRQWVVTAYVLAFGALLLLGGRVADYWGRKRTYLVGMVGFGLASVLGGIAESAELLIAARALQGAFAALLAPAALALLTVTFPSGKERTTAFAVFGTIAGAGSAVGLVMGGVLTEFASWRWCLLVNVFFVLVAFIGGIRILVESKSEGENRYDLFGALTVTLGLGSLVYGFSLAEEGWSSARTLIFLGVGIALMVAFVLIERRVSQPLLPLRIVVDRVRGGAFIMQAVVGVVMIGASLYIALHLQIILHFGPLQAGLATLPLTASIMVCAPLAAKLLPAVGPRPLLVGGPLIVAVGLFLLSGVTPGGTYAAELLPGMIVMGVGMAMIFVPVQNLALSGVAPSDAGAASATANATMQIGGSIGLSVFTALYASGMESSLKDGLDPFAAMVDGYGQVFLASAMAMLFAAVVSAVMIRGKKEDLMPQAGADNVLVSH